MSLLRIDLFSRPSPSPVPALFLDRDGVIIHDGHYLFSPDQVILFPEAKHVVAAANRCGWPVVVVTNQSGISRGLFTWHDYELVTERIIQLLAPVASLSAVYANGEMPGDTIRHDSWRKPSPLMLLNAASALNLDLGRSILIGDRLSDLQAAEAAGLHSVFHLMTGHGLSERQSVLDWYQLEMSPCLFRDIQLFLLDTLTDFPLRIFENY
jgi:D-glycero-D-manno-heptose 1,7-bisphosphate phosphatase